MSNKRRWMMVGSLAMALALGQQAALADRLQAERLSGSSVSKAEHHRDDAFLQTIGADDEEGVWDALYDGKTLADIAEDNGANPMDVIAMQIDELKALVKARFENGSIDELTYKAQLAEIPELIERSVYGGAASV
ncbi:hypothetical protein MO973_05230 [Paenibacillus sp. TRM 82003]|nr:hypothetical protein [Paenibacillus sp. TRM 82003]